MRIPLGQFGITTSALTVRRAKFGVSSLIFFTLFGTLFAVGGIFAFLSTQIDESWTRVQGKIVDVSSRTSDGSTMYTPIVEYVVDGESYRVSSNSSSSIYPTIGNEREVAYNPVRPDEAKMVEGIGIKLLILLFPAVGITILLVSFFSFVKSIRRTKAIKKLKQTGNKLQGVLVDVQSSGRTSGRRGSATYNLVVSATDTSGTVQNYVSDKLTGAIGQLTMMDFHKNPIPIDVYVDVVYPKNYYVDISMIPKLTPEKISELIKSATE